MKAFYENISPVGSSVSATTFGINVLDHNTGAYITAPVAAGGNDNKYTFPIMSDVNKKIMDSHAMKERVESYMMLEKPRVIQYFYDNHEATYTTRHINLGNQLAFGSIPDYDLVASFGMVGVQNFVAIVLVSSDLEVVSLHVSGIVFDTYDFNYDDPFFNKDGVIMQSGFGTHTVSGKYGGHVYRVEVKLDSTDLTDEFTTYFQ